MDSLATPSARGLIGRAMQRNRNNTATLLNRPSLLQKLGESSIPYLDPTSPYTDREISFPKQSPMHE
jgi:hypothetical protein